MKIGKFNQQGDLYTGSIYGLGFNDPYVAFSPVPGQADQQQPGFRCARRSFPKMTGRRVRDRRGVEKDQQEGQGVPVGKARRPDARSAHQLRPVHGTRRFTTPLFGAVTSRGRRRTRAKERPKRQRRPRRVTSLAGFLICLYHTMSVA